MNVSLEGCCLCSAHSSVHNVVQFFKFTHKHCICYAEEFSLRMESFRKYLEQRPEAVLAVVTHFGVLEIMTGRRFANCELWSCNWVDGQCM